MARVVHKYALDDWQGQDVKLPPDAKFVHFGFQDAMAKVWFEVPYPEYTSSNTRRFQIFGTGHEVEIPNAAHLASTQVGPLVWHLYEVPV